MSRPEPRSAALASVFAALGDPTRATILERLSREGRLTLTDLARGAPISRQAISRHVAVLSDAGLLTGAREGRELRLSLQPQALVPATDWLVQVAAAWDGALGRLARHVEADDG